MKWPTGLMNTKDEAFGYFQFSRLLDHTGLVNALRCWIVQRLAYRRYMMKSD